MRIRPNSFAVEDFPGLAKADPKFEELLSALNSTFKQLESGFNGAIGSDNLNRQIVELDIAAAQTYPIKVACKVNGKPLGVRAVRCIKTTNKQTGEPCRESVGVDWSVDGSTLLINGLPGRDDQEAWHVVGAAGEPAFAGTWVSFDNGATFQVPGFYKDTMGVVHLAGSAKGGVIGTALFTLPVGYRPLKAVVCPVQSWGAFGAATIGSTGIVTASFGSNLSFSLDGITFRAEPFVDKHRVTLEILGA